MKVFWAVIFSLCYVFLATNALPARRDPGEDVEFVPLESQRGHGPIIDTGVVSDGPWSIGPFDGFLESLAGIMASMRQQMDYLLGRLPFGNGTVDESSIFAGFPELDLSKANTTSVTKVIDGHKVVINETEYNQKGENGGTFFKVRIIDVLPDSSELTTEKNAETIPAKEPEPLESSLENEIPKNRETEDYSGLENFDEQDSKDMDILENNPVESFNSLEANPSALHEDSYANSMPYNLGSDTYVNKILAQRGAPRNPEAEVFRPMKFDVPFEKITSKAQWDAVESLEIPEDNSIMAEYRRPIDLNGDIYVNQMMADANAPTEPDAEVFSPSEYNRRSMGGPFERLISPR